MVSAGALESIVALTSHTDSSDIVSAAVSLLLSISSNAPGLRQYLGRAGAVEYFIHCLEELVTLDETLSHKYRIIDGLCQCCRDANNRIKIREQGGLSVLTDLLSNSELPNIHDRIISAFVCFIYDDASIAVLLQSSLVSTLVSHLYHVSGITKKPDFIGLDSFDICESLRTDLTETTDADPEYLDSTFDDDLKLAVDELTSFSSNTQAIQNNDLSSCAFSVDFGTEKHIPDTAVFEPLSTAGMSVLKTDQSNVDNRQDMLEFELMPAVDETSVPDPNAADVCDKIPRYSINSPTYQAVSAWRMELAGDEDEDSTHDRHSPRNIWEGARLYAETISALSQSHPESSSPARSLGSGSDGLSSVRSWSSSLCDYSPQKSPGVSPAWSLDSSGSGVYSPFSNSSYVYPGGSCSPSSFSDVDEAQPASLSTCDYSDDQLATATESNVFDNQTFQTHCLSVREAHCKSTVNAHLTENAVVTDVSDIGQQSDNVGSSNEDIIAGDDDDSNVPVTQSKLKGASEEEFKEWHLDDEFDAESFHRKKQDERRFSRLLDIAESMYASVERKPDLQSRQMMKRRHSSSSNTSLSVSKRHKLQCSDISSKMENISCVTETPGTSDSVALPTEDLQNSSTSNDSDSMAPKNLQIADDTNSGEVSSDTESNASDDTSACSVHHRNTRRLTERNILTLLSRISYSPETIAHVMNAGTICGLLDYALFASSPLPAAGRTLLRLSRSHHGFQRAVLCLFPLQAVWRMEPDLLVSEVSDDSCRQHDNDSGCLCQCISRVHRTDLRVDVDCVDHRASSLDAQSCMQEINTCSEMTEIIYKSKKGNHCSCSLGTQVDSSNIKPCAQECVASKLCNGIIANLSTIAVSGYGQGVISHLLLRGNHHRRQRCIISLCFLCRFVFDVIFYLLI